jgi:hypothetical protein
VQAERVEKVEYFHIELDSHDVIVAEGSFSETFIDDDSRGMFHNAHEYRAMYPDEAMSPAHYCAPRVNEGYALEAARKSIDDRAGLRSKAVDQPAAIRGFVDTVGSDSISGWALDPNHPEAPVCLDIFADGRLIGQVLANIYREDLEAAGLGSGRHAFEFKAPYGVNLSEVLVTVRRSLDGVPVASNYRRTRIWRRRIATAC